MNQRILHTVLLLFLSIAHPIEILKSMLVANHCKELQDIHGALVSINNIMRKYHQKNLDYSLQQTKCDGELLQNILIKNNFANLTPQQQQIIISEILGLLLFDLFFSGHYKESMTHINTLLPLLPNIERTLVFIPCEHLHTNNLYIYLEHHWHTLPLYQKLVFHLLLSIPLNIYYFSCVADYTPDKVIKRLVLMCNFKKISALPQNFKMFQTTLNSIAREQYNLHKKQYKSWKIFNQQLDTTFDQNKSIELIMTDEYPAYADFNITNYNFYTNYDPDITRFNIDRRSILVNNIELAAFFGAEETFFFFLNKIKKPSNSFINSKSLYKRAFINGNNTILKALYNTFNTKNTDFDMHLSDSVIQKMIKYDKTDTALYLKRFQFSKTKVDSTQPQDINYQENQHRNFIKNALWANPKEMDEIDETTIPSLYYAPLLQEMHNHDIITSKIPLLKSHNTIDAVLEPSQELKSLLILIHKHLINFNNPVSNEIITQINTLTKKCKKINPLHHDMIHEEIKGILLRHLFFAKPQSTAIKFVNKMLKKLDILQTESLMQSSCDDTTYRSKSREIRYQVFILNNIPKHITCIEKFKSIDTFIDFVFLYHVTTYRCPFFTLTMFKKAILALENEYTSDPKVTVLFNFLKEYSNFLHDTNSRLPYNIKESIEYYLQKYGQEILTPITCAAMAGNKKIFNYFAQNFFTKYPSGADMLIHYAIAGGNNNIIDTCLNKMNLKGPRKKYKKNNDKTNIISIIQTAIEYNNEALASSFLTQYKNIITTNDIPLCIIGNQFLWQTLRETIKINNPTFLQQIFFYAHINLWYHSLFTIHPRIARSLQLKYDEGVINPIKPMSYSILIETALESNDEYLLNAIKKELSDEEFCNKLCQKEMFIKIIRMGNTTALNTLIRHVPRILRHVSLHPRILKEAIRTPNPQILDMFFALTNNNLSCALSIRDALPFNKQNYFASLNALLKRLAKNQELQKFKLLWENSPRITEEEEQVFLYQSTRFNVNFFITYVVNRGKIRHTIEMQNSKAIVPSKKKFSLMDAACRHNNTELVSYLLKENHTITSSKSLKNAFKKNNYPLIKMAIKSYMQNPSYRSLSYKNQYKTILKELIDKFYNPPFESPVINALLEEELEKLNNNSNNTICLIHELIKMIPTLTNILSRTSTPRPISHKKIFLIIQSLLEKKPTAITLTTLREQSVLYLAAKYNKKANKITPLLLQAYSKADIMNSVFFNQLDIALNTAIEHNNIHFIQASIPYISQDHLNTQDYNQYRNTLLFKAIQQDRYEIAQILINHGANIHIQNAMNTSPLNLLYIKKTEHLDNVARADSSAQTSVAYLNKIDALLNIVEPNKEHNIQPNTHLLQEAIEQNNTTMIIDLINKGCSLIKAPENTKSPFISLLFEKKWDNTIINHIFNTYSPEFILKITDADNCSMLEAAAIRSDEDLLNRISKHPSIIRFIKYEIKNNPTKFMDECKNSPSISKFKIYMKQFEQNIQDKISLKKEDFIFFGLNTGINASKTLLSH